MDNKTVRIMFTCDHKDIIYINSVIDSYGGLGLMRTLDIDKYNCAYYSTKGMYKDAIKVFEALIEEGVSIRDIKTEETEDIDSFASE